MLQVLVFNTTTKTAKLYENLENKKVILEYQNVPTVKMGEGFYEIIISEINEVSESRRPVARIPILNTNMVIEK